MAKLTVTMPYAQANFEKMLDYIQGGVYTAIYMTNEGSSRDAIQKTITQNQATVGVIVPVAAFEAADSGLNTDRHLTPQIEFENIITNGLYNLTKKVMDANNETDTSTKASYTRVIGSGTIVFTAKDGGTGGNSASITIANGGALSVNTVGSAVTVTINTGVTTIAQVAAALADNSVMTANASGVTTTVITAAASQSLSGGTSGLPGSKFDAYYVIRTAGAPARAVIISNTCASAIGL